MLRRRPLPTDWTLRLAAAPAARPPPRDVAGAAVPATVPGCVHTDLMAAGLIPDPYPGHNEHATHFVGWCDWTYTTTLPLAAEDVAAGHLELAFDGLDTVAEVRLNGAVVGESKNMHVRVRFDIKPVAQVGDNELTVTFASPRRFAAEMEQRFGPLPHVGAGSNPQLPHQMMRKMACNFGWDWGPQLLTSGIWRPCQMEAWDTGRIADVRPLVRRADADAAELDVHVDVEGVGEVGVTLRDPAGAVVAEGRGSSPVRLTIENPQRWWPVGYGDQPLYALDVKLTGGGEELDAFASRVGLRTAELVTTPDPEPVEGLGRGETFHLQVNGRRVFCKGANWIPDDCFPHRVTPERYRERVDQAVGANMNMLRVWGGGIYEDAAFYEHCDERGVLVWQDFLMACACYPEERPYRDWVEAEARDNVARLARHPSLVLWNGCNENIWGTFDWAKEWVAIRTEGRRTWGLGYYLDLFPKAVAEIDPSRSYWPGSPYSGSMDRHPNANEFGNRHIWDVWNGHGDYRNYLGHFPRFASEFGYQGPPTWPTLRGAVGPDVDDWLDPLMRQHNKQGAGQERALARIADDFDPPRDFDEAWFLASVNQVRALTLGCEWFRALSPWCGGALYWQLNDCWPVTSWAAIDGAGRPKLLLEATRRFFRPRLLTIRPAAPGSAELAVYLHNDADEPWPAEITVRRVNFRGDVEADAGRRTTVAPRATARWPLKDEGLGEGVLVARVDDDTAFHFPGRDRDLPYERPTWTTRFARDGDAAELTVTSDVLVRDLCLLIDRLSPSASATPQNVHLLPGEPATFRISNAAGIEHSDCTRPDVLRCVNVSSRANAPSADA